MSNEEIKVTDLNTEEEVETVQTEETPKKKNIMSMVLICIGVLCIGVALYGLYGIYRDYKEADDIYQEAEEEFVHINLPTFDPTDTEDGEEYTGPWYERVSVDIAGLQKKYPNVVGWIYFEDGLISYPVMQTDDNETYLHTTYDGRESKSGSIFVEASHSGDFSDTHTIIYGHNMKNLSMFGRLKHYKTQAGYYDGHEYFQIFCGDEILRYQIFSYQDVPIDSFVYQEYFTSAKELSNRLLKSSYINPGLEIEKNDKIITLSTCTADDEHRFVVSAVLVEKYSVSEQKLIED